MTIILITVEIDVLFIIYIFCAYIYNTPWEGLCNTWVTMTFIVIQAMSEASTCFTNKAFGMDAPFYFGCFALPSN